jgi:hypothetical protein
MDPPDRPTAPSLLPLARELAASERLQAFAEDLRGAAARVSEPGLPPLLAALHLHLGRPLLVLLPEDADARDAAEAASLVPGRSRSRSFRAAASAGTRASSRRRISWASGRARWTCSPPAGSSARRRRRSRGVAAAGSSPARLAGRRRRAGDRQPGRAAGPCGLRAGGTGRGARAVRGSRRDRRRLPDHRPRPAAHRAVRRRDRGDPRVLAVHAAGAAAGGSSDRLPRGRAAARPRPDRAAGRRASRGTGRPRAADRSQT